MAIVQDAFVVPPEIMEKLLTGEYRRIGGVVNSSACWNKYSDRRMEKRSSF